MTFKEKVENNVTLYTLGSLFTGFVAGISTIIFLQTQSLLPLLNLNITSSEEINCSGAGKELDISNNNLSGFIKKKKFLSFKLDNLKFIIKGKSITGNGMVITSHSNDAKDNGQGDITTKGSFVDGVAYMEYKVVEKNVSWNGVIAINFPKKGDLIGYWLKEDIYNSSNFIFGNMICKRH